MWSARKTYGKRLSARVHSTRTENTDKVDRLLLFRVAKVLKTHHFARKRMSGRIIIV
jgi:hypothetical protein